MNTAIVVSIVSAIVTLGGVVITHILGQQGGEKRANQVRDDVTVRMTDMQQALSESIGSLDKRLDDFKVETRDRLGRLETDLSEVRDDLRADIQEVRMEIDRARNDLKELLRAELRASTAELRGAINDRTRRAGDNPES